MGCMLDELPVELIWIIWDYKLEMEEYEWFYAFLDRIYGTIGVFWRFLPKNAVFLLFLETGWINSLD